jgi:hypothetical protein
MTLYADCVLLRWHHCFTHRVLPDCKASSGQRIEVILSMLVMSAPILVLCEDRVRGVLFTVLTSMQSLQALDLQSPLWRSLHGNDHYDFPLGFASYMHCNSILLHELRLGLRYSFAQFRTDILTRSAIKVALDSSTFSQ